MAEFSGAGAPCGRQRLLEASFDGMEILCKRQNMGADEPALRLSATRAAMGTLFDLWVLECRYGLELPGQG